MRDPMLPGQTPNGTVETPYTDATDALWDVLLPSELVGGQVLPGAREAGVDDVLAGDNLLRAAMDLGLVPRLPEATLALYDDFAGRARGFLNTTLDTLAAAERPLIGFARLTSAQRDVVVARALDLGGWDDRTSPPLVAARAACWLAFLGAVTSDVGLQAIGFPPFEDFAAGLAVSGYPRMTNGKLDDYTYNRAPAATVGDDLSMIVDQNGDLR